MLLIKTYLVLTALTGVGYLLVLSCLNESEKEIGLKPLYAVLLSYAAIMFLPTLYVVYLAIFLLNPLLARSTRDSFSIFLICFITVPELREEVRFSSAYLFDFSSQAAMSLGAIASLALRGAVDRKKTRLNHIFFVVIFTSLLINQVRAESVTGYLRGFAITLISLALPYAVTAASIRKVDLRRMIIVTMSVAGGMLATIAIFEILTNWPIFAAIYDRLGLHPSLLVAKLRGGRLRAAGPMGESTEMGFMLVFCLLSTVASRRIFQRAWGHALVSGLIGLSLIAPQSKGGWIGAGLGIIALTAHRSSLARPSKFIAAAVPGAVLVFAASTYSSGEDYSQGSMGYRARLLKRGVEEFWKSPIIGDNSQSVVARMQDLKQGEHIVDFVNSYLYFALTLGAVGLIAILVAFFIPIVRSWRARRLAGGEQLAGEFSAFCFACFISSMAMFALTSFIHRAVILLMMFSVALARKPRPLFASSRLATSFGARAYKSLTGDGEPNGTSVAELRS